MKHRTRTRNEKIKGQQKKNKRSHEGHAKTHKETPNNAKTTVHEERYLRNTNYTQTRINNATTSKYIEKRTNKGNLKYTKD